MNNVIKLADHARASIVSRAAKRISRSDVKPASRARSVSNMADQYSAGILSLCHHLVTMPAETPISVANARRAPCASLGPQSSMIDRNEVKSDMGHSIGLIVLKCKPKPSLDCGKPLGHTVRMADNETETEYKKSFMTRVAAARRALGWKQWQMAEALDMPQDKYKQYESRSLLPHHLVRRFCLIARVDMEWLMTGRGKMSLQPLPEIEPDIAPQKKPTRKARRRSAA